MATRWEVAAPRFGRLVQPQTLCGTSVCHGLSCDGTATTFLSSNIVVAVAAFAVPLI
jgi:hypothetical protein